MFPLLFQQDEVSVFSYGVAILLGALIGGVWSWRSRPAGLFNLPQFLWICILTTLGASLGARALGLESAASGAMTGGLASTGVPLLVGPLVLAYCLWSRLDWRRVFDHLMPFALFGAGFQRIFGCFLGGCCRGQPSDAWLSVRFPGAAETVHPTQLYLGLSLFAVFFIFLRWQMPIRGQKAFAALGFYGLIGVLISPLRAGLGEPFLFGLTSYGLVHGAVAVGGLVGIWFLSHLESTSGGEKAGARVFEESSV